MQTHHKESINNFISIYKEDTNNLAILLGGSIAHGFATSESDIDVTIIVTDAAYEKRKQEKKLAFSLRDICTYEGGYVDCKVVSVGFLERVRDGGSDPSRYAFKDNSILFSRIDNLEELLGEIDQYPVQDKEARRERFTSQMLAWKWYYSEGVKKESAYLIHLAIHRFTLFACRIVLNENELLYPYHKWLLRVVESAENKPSGFDEFIKEILENHSLESVMQFGTDMLTFLGKKEEGLNWSNNFMKDSELNWLEHEPPIDDL